VLLKESYSIKKANDVFGYLGLLWEKMLGMQTLKDKLSHLIIVCFPRKD
jgi:hypothetical protein